MKELDSLSDDIPPDDMDWAKKSFLDLRHRIEATRARLPTKRNGRYRRRDRLWYGHNRKSVARDLDTVKEYWEVFDPSWLLERKNRCQTRAGRVFSSAGAGESIY